MKKAGLWNSLERWVTPAAVPSEWREALDGEFALAKPFLRCTNEPAEEMPCRQRPPCGCQHEVIHHSAERIVAACRCEERGCRSFPLRREEILIHELDRRRMCVAIRAACEFEPPPDEDAGGVGEPGTRMAGTFGDLSSPVFLTIRQKEQEFLGEMERLFNEGQGEPFLVLAPTDRHLTSTARALLRRHRCAFIPLSRYLEWDGAGKFKATESLKAVLERFRQGLAEGTGRVNKFVESGQGPPDYLIRQESTRRRQGKQDRTLISTWRFWFKGHEVLMPPWLGAEYLVHLMRKQGRQLEASALTHAVRKCGATGSSATASAVLYGDESAGADGGNQRGRVGELNERDVIWDATEIASAIRQIVELRKEIADHGRAGDSSSPTYLALKEALEVQQELLSHNAKQVKGKWVPKEYQKGTAKEKAELIGKHVRKLLDEHLRGACRPLFDHLNDKAILKYGLKNCYRPEPTIPWKFEFKEGNKGT